MEGGVLSAVTGRHNPKKPDNVVHRTLKHTTLHAMFQRGTKSDDDKERTAVLNPLSHIVDDLSKGMKCCILC